MKTLCSYQSKEGLCEGPYKGYACIRERCDHWKESHRCEYHDVTGDYCHKYARFGCVGKDCCGTISDYLEAVSEAEAV